MPPSVAAPEPPAWVLTQVGLARQPMTYIRTADTLPACSYFRPLVEPEDPPPETKAERIARLCKGGNVSVIEMKRAIEGR